MTEHDEKTIKDFLALEKKIVNVFDNVKKMNECRLSDRMIAWCVSYYKIKETIKNFTDD